jgi:ATP-dependent Clp protease ATP-binding subunit ClpB
LAQIVDIQVSWLQRRLEDRRIELEVSDEAKNLLAERGYDPVYGARPLKRVIQKMVETPLATKIMAGEVPDGSRLHLSADEQGIVFKVTTPGKKGEAVMEAV